MATEDAPLAHREVKGNEETTARTPRHVPIFFYVVSILIVLILAQMLREEHNQNAWREYQECTSNQFMHDCQYNKW